VHSRPPPQTRHPPASRPIPPQASCADGCADGCAVGARRSSGEGGNRPHSTRTVTGALAARLVVHRCTRGSKWGAPHARAAAASDSAKCARARSAVPRAAMGGTGACRTQTHVPRDAVRVRLAAHSAEGWVWCCRSSRRRPRCVPSPCTSVCTVVPVLARISSVDGTDWWFVCCGAVSCARCRLC
jgi:hypothetical protein